MSSDELLTTLHQLSRVEKWRIVQILMTELATEEQALTPEAHYEMWTPYDSVEAAATLMEILEEDKQKRDE